MDRVVYIGMVGVKEVEYRQQVNTNNIANASTDGFLASIASTRTLHSVGDGLPTRAYAMTSGLGVDHSESEIKYTGDKSDLTVRNNGWFRVVDPVSGAEHLKKNLKVAISPQGILVDASGARIQGSMGEIVVPAGASIEFSEQGEIYVRFPDQEELIRVDALSVVNTDNVSVNLKGQYVSPQVSPSADIQLVQGAIRPSNVNVVSASMETMALSSQYQLNMRIFDSAKKMSSAASKLIGN